jgi:hypothetical protein
VNSVGIFKIGHYPGPYFLSGVEGAIVVLCALAAIAGGMILGKPPLPPAATGGFPVLPPSEQPPQGPA